MKRKIYKYLNNQSKYAPLMAQEIAETFITEACEDNIDYSFTVNTKTGQVYSRDQLEPNTYFLFDTKGGTVLDKFKKALFDEDLKEIEEKSKEEEDLMLDVKNFLMEVCSTVTSKYYDDIRDTVRRVILGGKIEEELVPLKTIEVLSVDLADYTSVPESSKYLLKSGNCQAQI